MKILGIYFYPKTREKKEINGREKSLFDLYVTFYIALHVLIKKWFSLINIHIHRKIGFVPLNSELLLYSFHFKLMFGNCSLLKPFQPQFNSRVLSLGLQYSISN